MGTLSRRRVIRGLITVGKCKGPDPRQWWRTLWRRPLRTNKDGFSFTGRMHLHSLEAKASEPGLMKRNLSNCLDFNANERERETEGERQWKRSEMCVCVCVCRWAFKKPKELFPLQLQNTNEIRDICASHGGCLWLTLMQREHTEGGTPPETSSKRKDVPAQSWVVFYCSFLILLESFSCHYCSTISPLCKPWTCL